SIGGKKTISALIDHPEDFMETTSLSKIRILNLREKVLGDAYYEKLMLFMQSVNLNAEISSFIYDKYGKESITKIRKDPYQICSINEIPFKNADIIAKSIGLPFDCMNRIKSSILEFMDTRAKNNGDVCVEQSLLLSTLNTFLSYMGIYDSAILSEEQIQDAIDILIQKGKLVLVLSEEGKSMLYRKEAYDAETEILKRIKVMQQLKTPFGNLQKAEQFINSRKGNGIKQNNAIRMCLQENISILTGGPGTGKTYTVKQIVDCAHFLNPNCSIKLIAPTGRASSNLATVANLPAETIHRAIGLKPTKTNQFENKEVKMLEADIVIADEASMIDVYLFRSLLASLGPNTRLLLVGDFHQLPSVGPGLILRDLIESNVIPYTELTEIFRQAQASQIVMNAHALEQSEASLSDKGLSFNTDKDDFYFIEREDLASISQTIVEMTKRCVQKKHYGLHDILVLSPTKEGLIGTYSLNDSLQRLLNPPTASKQEFKLDDITTFREGDKVINVQNDADLDVYNGEIGTIDSIFVKDHAYDFYIRVIYPDKTIEYKKENFKMLKLAYAITAHKSQGTESNVIIMPISSSHEFMLTRNLVYTAWTRAKKLVICVGNKQTLFDIMKSPNMVVRQSLLKERLNSFL
ncbi:MAG: AAA family ATPase, partial [Oscillospiraceae bacterium]